MVRIAERFFRARVIAGSVALEMVKEDMVILRFALFRNQEYEY